MKNDEDNDEKCCIELDFKDMKKGTISGNNEKTIEQLNKENSFKNYNNQISYDELKYKVIEDDIENIKDKDYNDDINYKDIEKQICENFKEIEELYEEALFKNVDDKKRNYDDVYVEKMDANDTGKIKQLLNEEYLLKNDYDNDEKCCNELDFEDIKKGTIYGNSEKTIEQSGEENLFNIINKRLIHIIINKMKNEGNGNAFYKIINEKNISETFVSQFLKCVMDSNFKFIKKKINVMLCKQGVSWKIQEI